MCEDVRFRSWSARGLLRVESSTRPFAGFGALVGGFGSVVEAEFTERMSANDACWQY